MTQSLDQRRAAFVWTRLDAKPIDNEYVNLAKAAPALIMTSGLMQTLAFYQEKSRKPQHERILGDLCTWLANEQLTRGASFAAVMRDLHGSSADVYARATEEALEILRWFRQLAAAKAKGG